MQATAAAAHKLLKKLCSAPILCATPPPCKRCCGSIRNLGETGIAMMAVSAIDNALWDLRARLLDLPLVSSAGTGAQPVSRCTAAAALPTYTDQQLSDQLGGWASNGFASVKMKIGTHPDEDPARVETARNAIGDECNLFVDANGAYTVTQAIDLAQRFAEQDVRWFEEPVSSDNLTGLSQVRAARAPLAWTLRPASMATLPGISARCSMPQAVTVLQADATRCGGISGFLDAAALCWAHNVPLSSHCGPSMHLHVCCAVPRAIHMEFFHDHARIERMFFDGFCEPVNGCMIPDLTRAREWARIEGKRCGSLPDLIEVAGGRLHPKRHQLRRLKARSQEGTVYGEAGFRSYC